MGRKLCFVAALAVGVSAASAASAARKPLFVPPPSWVEVAPIPDAAPETDVAIQTLLDDNQSRLGPDGDAAYNRRVQRIVKPEGLSQFTTFGMTWDPDTETVMIHALKVIRGAKAIDLPQGGKNMLVLRREQDLESSILDGRISASQQLDGLQVGDILDISWTEVRKDPIAEGHSYDMEGEGFGGVAARYRVRLSWPDGAPMHWRATAGFGQPTISHHDGRTWLDLDLKDAEAPKPPIGAPLRFRRVGLLETSGWSSWTEVSKAMWPHYEKAMTLEPGSPLKAEAAAIAAAHPDAKGRAYAALQLVEDKTRYFLIALDQGGYVPAAADETWRRKFGDCKGKTVLLLALLKELGVQAEPVLVNMGAGDGVDERPPSLAAFNHVMVRATIDGKSYWLDGTRQGDRSGIDRLKPPPYRWGLPLRQQGAELQQIAEPTLDQPTMDGVFRIDASKGLDAPATAQVSMRFTGDAAIGMRMAFANTPKADLDRAFKQLMSGRISWFTPQTINWTDDVAHDAVAVEMSGVADLDWRLNPDVGEREYKVVGSSSNAPSAFPHREPGPNADAPFSVPFPFFFRGETEIVLPAAGKGFTIRGPNGTDMIGGYEVKRSSTLQAGVASFLVEMRSLKPEITPAAAEEANKAFRQLSDEESLVRAPK